MQGGRKKTHNSEKKKEKEKISFIRTVKINSQSKKLEKKES